MRRMMALITAVLVLCVGCSHDRELTMPDTRATSAAVEDWMDRGGWEGENLELQRRLVRWYALNLQSEQPEPGFHEGYNSILAGPGGIMGWVEFPDTGAVLPLRHEGCTGEGFLHQRDTPFPTGEGGTSILWLSSGQQELWSAWLAMEPEQIFRVHILDLMITYRMQSPESGMIATDDCCVLIFPRAGEDLTVLGIREDP